MLPARILPAVAALMGASLIGAAPLLAGPVTFEVFHTRAHYTSVLLQQGRVQVDADWNEEPPQKIDVGQAFGIFRFDFDPTVIQPVVAPGVVGGLAVGAEPDGTIGGDQGITLRVEPGTAIDAFGVEIDLTPFDGLLAKDIFRLSVCGPGDSVISVGNLELDDQGRKLFLGIIAMPGFDFSKVTVEAVTPRDDQGHELAPVPGWQISSLSFAPVPEPCSSVLLATGLLALAASRRARHRRR